MNLKTESDFRKTRTWHRLGQLIRMPCKLHAISKQVPISAFPNNLRLGIQCEIDSNILQSFGLAGIAENRIAMQNYFSDVYKNHYEKNNARFFYIFVKSCYQPKLIWLEITSKEHQNPWTCSPQVSIT